MPKGKMTLEFLAGLVQDGFSSMEGQMEQRFNKVENEFAAIRRQLSNAVYQPELVALEHRVTALERRVKIGAKR